MERFCGDALTEHAPAIPAPDKLRAGQMDRSQLLLRPTQQRFFGAGGAAFGWSAPRSPNLATALVEHNDRLFTFPEQEDVESTNNSVGRALRTGVQWRKIRFGSRSANGELATSRSLTIGRNPRPSKPQHPGLSLRSDYLPSHPSKSRLTAASIGPTELLRFSGLRRSYRVLLGKSSRKLSLLRK